ncbi:hypothetical protein AA313_de0202289 [Arthrobotrys entomopaga]|nr:hypothetical protein AA313_de0202289 [Arthrobotrys entomopaga]
MDFSTSTTSLHHPHHHHHYQPHHNHSPSPASSRSRAVSSHKQSAGAPLQIHRSASASVLIASTSGSRSAGPSNSQGPPSDPRSKKSSPSTAAPPPPVPNIPSFHLRNTNGQTFSSGAAPNSFNSFAGSRPGSAKLTIDTSLSNSYLRLQQQPQQNRSVSDTPYLTANQYQSSSGRRNLAAAGDGYLTASKSTPTDRHELVAPSDIGFRNSLVDNLLLDFDKLGQDFSCDPVFDKFLDPFYSDTLNTQGDTYAYQDQDCAQSRLPTSYHQRKRSESNPVLPHRFYETQRSPKDQYLEEEEDVFEHNGTLVYTSDGRFITTPPQSRRGAPPSRQQSYTFEPFSDAAPTPRISNRSRAREPELPRQSNHLQRKRSTRSNKSLRRATDTMAEQAALPTIPSEMPPSEPLASVPAKQTSKPGFFRRVFGGGVTVAPRSSSISQTQPYTEENARPAEGIKRHASVSANPVSHVPDQIPPRTPQLVTKKSSGFFRRRKRSESEHEPVPDLPKASTFHNDTEVTFFPSSWHWV